jgi:signal transduction histidine kinase
MSHLQKWVKRSSLKVKWSIGASSAIFITFFLFSCLQYNFISKWLLHEEQTSVLQVLEEMESRGPFITMDDLLDSKDIIKQVMEKDQTIRILDKSGKELLSVKSKNSSPFYIPFQPVSKNTTVLLKTDKDEIYVGRGPIHTSKFSGYVEVVYPLYTYHRLMRNLLVVMAVFGAISLVLSGLFGFIMAKNFLKPLQRLAATMQSIRKKGFQARMEPNGSNDEMGDLTNIFNEMMDKIEQSFIQQKQFVEDASHELRTPVQIMEGHLNLLNRWGKNNPDILEESLSASLQELDRMKKLVQELLDLSRAEQPNQTIRDQNTNALQKMHQIIKNFELIHEDFIFNLHTDPKINTIVKINENHFEQIMIIVLDNAVKYSDEVHKVDITLKEENQFLHIDIQDYGVGIPSVDLPNIFHRFYRVDKARSREKGGNGLGLAIAKQIIESYSGKIYARSKVGEGTTITFLLPKIG